MTHLVFPISREVGQVEKGEEKAEAGLSPKEEEAGPLVSPPEKIADILKDNKTDIRSTKIDHVARTIYRQSKEYGYDPLFILAIIKTESSFLNRAVSHKGARGLMQIVPATAREIARKNDMRWDGRATLHVPWTNVRMGTYYLSQLLQRFDGDIEIALEAYNNGPTRISRLIRKGRRLPFKYSKKVLGNYEGLLKTYGSI